jgi:hypothetical protein
MRIPVNINLEVEGHGSATACTVDVDTSKPLIGQLTAALDNISAKELEHTLCPQRWVIGAEQ